MSILNSRFTDPEFMNGATAYGGDLVAQTLERVELDERQESILGYLREGLSLADILGITAEQRDAVRDQACRFIQAGEVRRARDLLLKLTEWEPTDERAMYLLGATFQLEGELERAAFFYIQFLALDATNPEGYLRLGECLMSSGEIEEARNALDTALSFANEGKGRPGNAGEAERLLAILEAQRQTN